MKPRIPKLHGLPELSPHFLFHTAGCMRRPVWRRLFTFAARSLQSGIHGYFMLWFTSSFRMVVHWCEVLGLGSLWVRVLGVLISAKISMRWVIVAGTDWITMYHSADFEFRKITSATVDFIFMISLHISPLHISLISFLLYWI